MNIPVSEIHRAGGLEAYLRREGREGVKQGKGSKEPKRERVYPVLPQIGRADVPGPVLALLADPMVRAARGRTRPNGWECEYGVHLNALFLAGEVLWHRRELLEFEIGYRCTYTPDEIILAADGALYADDVKGHMREDANVKIKVAARQFAGVTFRVAKLTKDGWKLREIKR